MLFLLPSLTSNDPALSRSRRTDRLMRMEAAMNGTTSGGLIPCPQCNLSFCCSPAHWEAARALHHAPCDDACDGLLSQCEMSRERRAHLKFETLLAKARGYHWNIFWVPERVKTAWILLAGLSWESEFGDEMRRSFGVPAWRPITPWIRAASDTLTMAMTILYGLEKLNDDDAWTRKHTLTVHVSALCFLFM
jgi:splicing suppressor protein 51